MGELFDSYSDLNNIQSLDDTTNKDLKILFLFTAGMEPDLVAGCFEIERDHILEVEIEKIQEIASYSEVKAANPPEDKKPEKVEPKKVSAPASSPAPAAAAPAKPAKAKNTLSQSLSKKKAEETIRVSVGVLDDLMTLAGEMVLGRNQLVRQASGENGGSGNINAALQTINVVTSDLQEKVMQTRLQPIGSILGKFNRIIRDLGTKLEKEIDLEIQGKDVNLIAPF